MIIDIDRIITTLIELFSFVKILKRICAYFFAINVSEFYNIKTPLNYLSRGTQICNTDLRQQGETLQL